MSKKYDCIGLEPSVWVRLDKKRKKLGLTRAAAISALIRQSEYMEDVLLGNEDCGFPVHFIPEKTLKL